MTQIRFYYCSNRYYSQHFESKWLVNFKLCVYVADLHEQFLQSIKDISIAVYHNSLLNHNWWNTCSLTSWIKCKTRINSSFWSNTMYHNFAYYLIFKCWQFFPHSTRTESFEYYVPNKCGSVKSARRKTWFLHEILV